MNEKRVIITGATGMVGGCALRICLENAGQMFPGTILAPLFFPLNKGLHLRQGSYFFVSQGAGPYMMRLRLGSSNEINLIRLKVKQ